MASSLAGFVPQIVLAATAVAVLVGDLLLAGRPGRRPSLAVLTALGLTAAALAVRPSAPDASLFSGLIALDGFARFFLWFFLAAALAGTVFGALSDEVHPERYGEYLILLLCLTLGMCLLAAARHLLMIYLSIELVSLPSYVLAGFRRGDRRSSEAALKYVIYGAAASGLMLYGFSLLYGLTGSLDLAGVGRAVSNASQDPASRLVLSLAALFSLAGFGYKVAAVPFHMWCPDVYEGAPTPFVAFLSVAPKAAGFAALLRFLLVGFDLGGLSQPPPFPWPVLLGLLAMATMTLGNLVAVVQDNLKRLLAYSSIAHAGYMLMAVAVGTDAGLRAVLLYLVVYFAMNLGAFLAVMAVREKTGSESIADYRGLGARSPFLAATLAIFLFSLTGIPPLAGFIGKFYLFAAVLAKGGAFFYVVAIVGVLNSAVSLYYYARVVKAMYLDHPETDAAALPLSGSYAALLALLALPTLALGVWWHPVTRAIERSSSLFP